MVDVQAQVTGGADINLALAAFSNALGEGAATAPKVAAMSVCNSMRARTKKAPKRARPNEYRLELHPDPPRYITYKDGRKLDRPLHRWLVTRKLGTPDQYTKSAFAYVGIKTDRKGRPVKNLAAEKAELRKFQLGIFHAGLAKQSWNWSKGEISGKGKGTVWKKRRNDLRNPKDSVSGSYRRDASVTTSGGVAEIHNRLDYISAAMPSGAEDAALSAAARDIMHRAEQVVSRNATTPEDAARAAADFFARYRADVARTAADAAGGV